MEISILGHRLPHNLATVTCEHVLAGRAIRLVSYEHDGAIQVMCGRGGHGVENGRLVALKELADRLTASGVPPLDIGQQAERRFWGWRVFDLPPESEES